MFGYVTVNRPELKIKDFEKYRSYYCGLCRTLNNEFGIFGRMTLNYDMTFLIMVLSDLYDEEEKIVERRCIVHPFIKHKERVSPVTKYSSDMCLLLSYYKLLDDWKDDGKLKSKIGLLLLKNKIKRLEVEYPEKAQLVKNRIDMLNDVENNRHESIDKVAKLFGDIMAEMFIYKDDEYKNDLYRMGFYLGKYIYLLDAYEDVEDDIKNGTYNPFVELSQKDDFDEQVLNLLLLMISECTDAFERLPLIENQEILRNILYSGVWERYNAKKEKKEEDGSV